MDKIDWIFLSEVGFSVDPKNRFFDWPAAPDVKVEIVPDSGRVVCLIGRKTQVYLNCRDDVMDLVRLLRKEPVDG